MFLLLEKSEYRIRCLGPNAFMEGKNCDLLKISQYADLSVSILLILGRLLVDWFGWLVGWFLFGFFVCWLVCFALFSSGIPSNLFVYVKCSF